MNLIVLILIIIPILILTFLILTAFSSMGTFIAGKINGYEFLYLSILGLKIVRENNKLTIKLGKFHLNIECCMVENRANTIKNKISFKVIEVIFTVIVTSIILGFMPNSMTIKNNFFFRWIVIELILFNIFFIVLAIKFILLYLGNSTDSIFVRDLADKINLLRFGISPGGLVFKNIELPKKVSTKLTVRRYNLFHYYNLLEKKEFCKLEEFIYDMENDLAPSFKNYETNYYYEIIFYYSAIKNNEEKARKYFNIVYRNLINDKDINGQRVYSYYKYFIDKNIVKAKEIAREGLDIWDKFPNLGLAKFEVKLLENLINLV